MTSPLSTWGRGALLSAVVGVSVLVPALSYSAAGGGAAIVGRWNRYPSQMAAGYVVTDLGCVDSDAGSLHKMFGARIRPVLGLDNPHVIDLGARRYLWLFNDTWVDYTNRARSLVDGTYLANVAVLQEHDCFRLVRQGSKTEPRSFEQGTGERFPHYFWPLGGQAVGGQVHVFWAEMLTSRREPAKHGDGLNRHPVRTWLATYDATTLERLDFRPAPDDGVYPQYGYAVAADETHTYLFGNSNMLDLSREGGFYDGPHSATKMYLARVPLGELATAPEYRTANGWSDDPRRARPFSKRFWTDNGMQPVYLDGRWLAVTKVDGFWGTETIVEVAGKPWGPWRIASRREVAPARGFDVMTNYQPIILPYRDPAGDLIIVMSQNARHWPEAVDDSSMYRPQVYTEPWPFRE